MIFTNFQAGFPEIQAGFPRNAGRIHRNAHNKEDHDCIRPVMIVSGRSWFYQAGFPEMQAGFPRNAGQIHRNKMHRRICSRCSENTKRLKIKLYFPSVPLRIFSEARRTCSIAQRNGTGAVKQLLEDVDHVGKKSQHPPRWCRRQVCRTRGWWRRMNLRKTRLNDLPKPNMLETRKHQ